MLVVISPAKKLDFDSNALVNDYGQPDFIDRSKELINVLKQFNAHDISKLMKLSPKLSELNVQRYSNFKTPFTLENAKQAAYAFKGDTYVGLNFESFKEHEVYYAQNHLRILSGLYGVLRPLDLIQPYRLEMGTKLKIQNSKNLYEWWKEDITNSINKELKEKKILINLASNEYFSSIDTSKLNGQLINIQFLELKNGIAKINSLFAKRARGMMASFILKNKIKNIEDLKKFNTDGYQFDTKRSLSNELVFVR